MITKPKRQVRRGLAVFFFVVLFFSSVLRAAETTITLPGGEGGVGFDDLRYSRVLHKILVPGGRTGNLFLIDTGNQSVSAISGFSSQSSYGGGHGEGITSVDEGEGYLFVTDRSSEKLNAVDPNRKTIIASAGLAATSDYVRYVSPTHEIWVTEPEKDQIEVFSLSTDKNGMLKHSAFISVPGGPEALLIDSKRSVAYTNLWKDKTVAIDLKSRKILTQSPNGCEDSRGLAMDINSNLLFVGCSEGKAVALDMNHSAKIISSVSSGSKVDIIDFDVAHRRLFLPGAATASMAIISVTESGLLSISSVVPTAHGSHCVVSDEKGSAYVCDPDHGRLLIVTISK